MSSKASDRSEQSAPTHLHEVDSATEATQRDASDSEFWLNYRADRINLAEKGVAVECLDNTLNQAYRSAYGIAAIVQIMNNDNDARADSKPYLSHHLVGGLLAAAGALADNIEKSIDDPSEEGEGHGHGVKGKAHVQ